jgi:hypothetical protein
VSRVKIVAPLLAVAFAAVIGMASGPAVSAQNATIKAVARDAPTPPWNKGIVPISPESYYNAIECGKQGGQDPPCVFWDTGLCKNDDFTLAFFTPYKFVSYEVWRVVQQKKPAPQPNYAEAQRTRVTIGVTPVRGSTNTFSELRLKRGARAVTAVDRSLAGGGGRYTFDFPAFAAGSPVTLELVGAARTVTCQIDAPVLAQFR